MQICDTHWTKMKEAVKARGLYGFVSGSGQEVVKRMKSESDGKPVPSDPLMDMYMMITRSALDCFGPAVLNEGVCPVCMEIEKHKGEPAHWKYPTLEAYFIDGPADAVLRYFQEKGWVPGT